MSKNFLRFSRPLDAFLAATAIMLWIIAIAVLMTLRMPSDDAPARSAVPTDDPMKKVFSSTSGVYLFTGREVGGCTPNGILFKEVSGPHFGPQLRKTSLCVQAASVITLNLNDPNVFLEGDHK